VVADYVLEQAKAGCSKCVCLYFHGKIFVLVLSVVAAARDRSTREEEEEHTKTYLYIEK